MTSVRVRLVAMAVLPLIVLMPLLLILGSSRWTADYDRVLIANVESDLRIAEQYLTRILEATGNDLAALADATGFAEALASDPAARDAFLAGQRDALGLDFLRYLSGEALAAERRWPVIATAAEGTAATRIDVFAADDLGALSPALAERARIPLVPTTAALPTTRVQEDRGMVVHSASPVRIPGHDGVLVGGILLNRNLGFIDAINALVYLNAVTGGTRQGTATLFLDDVRVSTNVRLFEDVRALGTRVSAEVRKAVLDEGRTWLDRAFVVNDWYISGYLPLTDSFGARVGMLYVGFLETPFTAVKRAAVLWMLAAFLGVLMLSAPLLLWLATGIFAPLERMTRTMNRVETGDLSARIGHMTSRDEIGQVAAHLDSLLDQVQARDRDLRAWADALNSRVEARTAELRDTNAKLEETYRQLVMSEKLAAIGEITAGVAHEINNPVAVIQGNVDVIRQTLGPEADPVRTELDLVDRQVSRITGIVGKLLQFARPSDYAGSDETVDIVPLVADGLMLVDHVLSRLDIEVSADLMPEARVRIDPGEMQQVAVNLILNAVQAMGDAGRLEMRLAPEPRDGRDGVCLRIADSGPGLDPATLDSVFDPFFTTKPGEGTGLGLSISQTIVQKAGGIITAANRPDGGAEFRVWLPRARD